MGTVIDSYPYKWKQYFYFFKSSHEVRELKLLTHGLLYHGWHPEYAIRELRLMLQSAYSGSFDRAITHKMGVERELRYFRNEYLERR